MTITRTCLLMKWLRRAVGDFQARSAEFVDQWIFPLHRSTLVAYPVRTLGAIGLDWVTIDDGGVPWLISRPRKKPIT